MNVIVVRSDGSWYVRPDTSIERESEEIYLPDGFVSVEAFRCVWIRITKAGKAVNPKFAARYYDSFGKGATIYCKKEDGSLCPFVDGSTVIGQDIWPMERLVTEAPEIRLDEERVAASICGISRLTSIRIGDLFLFEAAESISISRGQEACGIAVL